MHSEVAIAASPGRLPRIEARGGLAARCTEPDTVHLVSAAATPLGGDTLTVRVVVEAGARLRIRTAAATMVLPGTATVQSAAHWELEVAGQLDVDPEPTVVAAAQRIGSPRDCGWPRRPRCESASGSRSVDPVNEKASGRRRYMPTSVRRRCYVIESN